jgi:hypothetical protein
MFNTIFFFENITFYENMWKNNLNPERSQMIFHAGWLRLKINSQNVLKVLLFHSNNGSTNAPRCYIILNLSDLFNNTLEVTQ